MIFFDLFSDRLIGQPDTRSRHHMRPQQVPGLINYFIEDIAVGVDHTLALTSLGDIWAWGNNADGQLGLGHTSSPIREPQVVPGLEGKDIRQVNLGNMGKSCCFFFFTFFRGEQLL